MYVLREEKGAVKSALCCCCVVVERLFWQKEKQKQEEEEEELDCEKWVRGGEKSLSRPRRGRRRLLRDKAKLIEPHQGHNEREKAGTDRGRGRRAMPAKGKLA